MCENFVKVKLQNWYHIFFNTYDTEQFPRSCSKNNQHRYININFLDIKLTTVFVSENLLRIRLDFLPHSLYPLLLLYCLIAGYSHVNVLIVIMNSIKSINFMICTGAHSSKIKTLTTDNK